MPITCAWTPWVPARCDLLPRIPADPGIYAFGLVWDGQIDVSYIGSGIADDGGLRARLRVHLSGFSHIPEIREAIQHGAAMLSWMPTNLALQMERELIPLFAPAFNTAHNPHPRRIEGPQLGTVLSAPVPDGDYPVRLPGRIRAYLTGQLPAWAFFHPQSEVLPRLSPDALCRVLHADTGAAERLSA